MSVLSEVLNKFLDGKKQIEILTGLSEEERKQLSEETLDWGNCLHAIVDKEIIDNIDPVKMERAKLDFINMLLENNLVDVNCKQSETGYSFIHLALYGYTSNDNVDLSYSTDFIENLIEIAKKHSFDVNSKDDDGDSIIHTAMASEVYTGSVVRLIKALGNDFDINCKDGMSHDIIEALEIYKDEAENENEDWYSRLSKEEDQIIKAVEDIRNKSSNNEKVLSKKITFNQVESNPLTSDDKEGVPEENHDAEIDYDNTDKKSLINDTTLTYEDESSEDIQENPVPVVDNSDEEKPTQSNQQMEAEGNRYDDYDDNDDNYDYDDEDYDDDYDNYEDEPSEDIQENPVPVIDNSEEETESKTFDDTETLSYEEQKKLLESILYEDSESLNEKINLVDNLTIKELENKLNSIIEEANKSKSKLNESKEVLSHQLEELEKTEEELQNVYCKSKQKIDEVMEYRKKEDAEKYNEEIKEIMDFLDNCTSLDEIYDRMEDISFWSKRFEMTNPKLFDTMNKKISKIMKRKFDADNKEISRSELVTFCDNLKQFGPNSCFAIAERMLMKRLIGLCRLNYYNENPYRYDPDTYDRDTGDIISRQMSAYLEAETDYEELLEIYEGIWRYGQTVLLGYAFIRIVGKLKERIYQLELIKDEKKVKDITMNLIESKLGRSKEILLSELEIIKKDEEKLDKVISFCHISQQKIVGIIEDKLKNNQSKKIKNEPKIENQAIVAKNKIIESCDKELLKEVMDLLNEDEVRILEKILDRGRISNIVYCIRRFEKINPQIARDVEQRFSDVVKRWESLAIRPWFGYKSSTILELLEELSDKSEQLGYKKGVALAQRIILNDAISRCPEYCGRKICNHIDKYIDKYIEFETDSNELLLLSKRINEEKHYLELEKTDILEKIKQKIRKQATEEKMSKQTKVTIDEETLSLINELEQTNLINRVKQTNKELHGEIEEKINLLNNSTNLSEISDKMEEFSSLINKLEHTDKELYNFMEKKISNAMKKWKEEVSYGYTVFEPPFWNSNNTNTNLKTLEEFSHKSEQFGYKRGVVLAERMIIKEALSCCYYHEDIPEYQERGSAIVRKHINKYIEVETDSNELRINTGYILSNYSILGLKNNNLSEKLKKKLKQ